MQLNQKLNNMENNFSNCTKFYVMDLATATLKEFASVSRYQEKNPENIAISGDGIQSYAVKKSASVAFGVDVVIATDLDAMKKGLKDQAEEASRKMLYYMRMERQSEEALKAVSRYKRRESKIKD